MLISSFRKTKLITYFFWTLTKTLFRVKSVNISKSKCILSIKKFVCYSQGHIILAQMFIVSVNFAVRFLFYTEKNAGRFFQYTCIENSVDIFIYKS